MSATSTAAVPAPDAERVVQAGEVRMSRIESLRALAALGVLGAHTWGAVTNYQPELFVGTFQRRLMFGMGYTVFLFFALSGFLISWPFVRRYFGADSREGINLKAYAMNRALRVLPLYWLAVVVLLIVQNHGGTFDLWWRHLLFVQTGWFDTYNEVDGPLWSVALEIQFYALLPFLWPALAWVTKRSRLRAALILGVLCVASYLLRRHLASHVGLWTYQMPTTFFFFAAGMLAALLRGEWEEKRPRLLDGPLGSSTLWVLAGVPLWLIVVYRPDFEGLCAISAFVIVCGLVLPLRRGRLIDAIEWRPIALLGVATYSLYVWHVPIIDAVGVTGHGFLKAALVAYPLSIAAAVVSYRLIESPALRLRRQWARSSAAQVES